MRRALHVVLAVMAAGLLAQPAQNDTVLTSVGSPDAAGIAQTDKVSIELKDAPLKEALKQILDSAGAQYDIVGDNPNVSRTVSIKMTAIPLDKALELLSQSQGLRFSKENGRYRIDISPPGSANADDARSWAYQMLSGRSNSQEVSMTLGEMTAAEAVDQICAAAKPEDGEADCNWTFEKNLGDTTMPGVRFYKFPKELAVKMALLSAGLAPSADHKVSQKRKVRPQDVLQWSGDVVGGGASFLMPHMDVSKVREQLQKELDKKEKQGQSQGFSGGFTFAPGAMGGMSAPFLSAFGGGALSMAGRYDPLSKRWLYTIFARQARDTTVLESLLSLSGAQYVMADSAERSGSPSVWAMAEIQKKAEMVRTGLMPPADLYRSLDAVDSRSHLISTQLYDVTLEEALGTLADSVGLVYKKKGTTENPIYMLEQQRAAAQPRPAPKVAPKPK